MTLRTIQSLVIGMVLSFSSHFAIAQGVLENPARGGTVSGIGVVSGWKCEAQEIEVRFDGGPPIEAAYGTSRNDTSSVCGDNDNGYGLLINFNLLGEGSHDITVFADGVEFATAKFEVVTLGDEPFITGLSRTATIRNFPTPGASVSLSWTEGKQNFGVTKFSPASSAEGKILIDRMRGGRWLFDYDIISRFQDEYTISGTISREENLWHAFGTDEFGGTVVAAFDMDTELLALLRPGTIIDDFFVFDFVGEDAVDGCHFTVSPAGSNNLSSCDLFAGTRGASYFGQGGTETGGATAFGMERQSIDSPLDDPIRKQFTKRAEDDFLRNATGAMNRQSERVDEMRNTLNSLRMQIN